MGTSYTLPVEIWRTILGFATDRDPRCRHNFADPFIPPYGEESLRAKLDISLVSRLFRDIGREYLYEALVLCSDRNVAALQRSLAYEATRKNFEIDLHFVRIADNARYDISNHAPAFACLQTLLSNVERLHGLSVRFTPVNRRDMSRRLVQHTLNLIPLSVRYLDWSTPYSDKALCDIFRHHTQIRALSFMPVQVFSLSSQYRHTDAH